MDIEQIRRIVEQHQYEEVDGVLVDAQTAQAIVAVYDALKPENQVKFAAMDVTRAGLVAWKLVSK